MWRPSLFLFACVLFLCLLLLHCEFRFLRDVNLGGATQHIEGKDLGKKPLVKNSSFKTVFKDGLSSGLSLRSLCINLAAERVILDGIAYSLLRIRMYVSFKQLVSKGGRPTRRVYLKKYAKLNSAGMKYIRMSAFCTCPSIQPTIKLKITISVNFFLLL